MTVWTDLAAAFAYGTKLTSAQMQQLRDNITAAFEKASGAPVLADSYILSAMLSTSLGSVSTAVTANLTLPGGQYGFYPQVKIVGGTSGFQAFIGVADVSTYFTSIRLSPVSGGTVYAQQRYVTSSGEVYWVFILRDIVTKEVVSVWQAPDHPCFGNGGKPELAPHPFPDINEATQEVVVINPSYEQVGQILDEAAGKDFIEVLLESYEIDESVEPKWSSKEITVGLPSDFNILHYGVPCKPIKMKIPKPDNVKTAILKKKVSP